MSYLASDIASPDPYDHGSFTRRIGVIDTTAPLGVFIDGVPVPAKRLASYTPVVGHTVVVEWVDGQLIVYGQIV